MCFNNPKLIAKGLKKLRPVGVNRAKCSVNFAQVSYYVKPHIRTILCILSSLTQISLASSLWDTASDQGLSAVCSRNIPLEFEYK